MNKLLIAALGAVLFVAVGCQTDNTSSRSTRTTTTRDGDTTTVRTERSDTMRGEDDCPHCPGVQHARADGTCPQCGAKVKSAAQ